MVTAKSTPNIALIKYWGNRNNELRLPAADSLSMTINKPTVEATVDHAETLAVESFLADGSEKELNEKSVARFQKHIDLMKQYLATLDAPDAIPHSLSITIRSHIPPAVGLASSAAVFSCIARAVSGLIAPSITLTDQQTSVLARLGSGSACRGIGNGYVAIHAGDGDAIDSAYAVEIAPADHWTLHDIIVVPSQDEKKVGSTEGHALAHTSPYFTARIEAITSRRQPECCDAILAKDFERLQQVAEEDCWDMHNVMQTSSPSLQYLSDETYRITDEITELREREHLPVLFTMDAGPTVHLFCTDEAQAAVLDFANAQAGCTVFETQVGNGATLVK